MKKEILNSWGENLDNYNENYNFNWFYRDAYSFSMALNVKAIQLCCLSPAVHLWSNASAAIRESYLLVVFLFVNS